MLEIRTTLQEDIQRRIGVSGIIGIGKIGRAETHLQMGSDLASER